MNSEAFDIHSPASKPEINLLKASCNGAICVRSTYQTIQQVIAVTTREFAANLKAGRIRNINKPRIDRWTQDFVLVVELSAPPDEPPGSGDGSRTADAIIEFFLLICIPFRFDRIKDEAEDVCRIS